MEFEDESYAQGHKLEHFAHLSYCNLLARQGNILLISGSHLNAWVLEYVQMMDHLQLHDINQEKLAYKDGVSGDETVS
jgi:hypothetical protein